MQGILNTGLTVTRGLGGGGEGGEGKDQTMFNRVVIDICGGTKTE